MIFAIENNKWSYEIRKCAIVPYEKEIYSQLEQARKLTLKEQQELDFRFGKWIGEKINLFKNDIEVIDLVGVHGHTVIHEPENKISWQLGRGDVIAKTTGNTTITEFRTKDVKSGGQGAPLVPYGDFTLFSDYDACLNLGGIANISVKKTQTAWDICPCNQVLNYFSKKLGKPFDEYGKLAKKGNLDSKFYSSVSETTFFSQAPPKSLPNHFIRTEVLEGVEALNGLHTYCQIVAEQIAGALRKISPGKLLITGGGAFNTYLISLIRDKLKGWNVVIPDSKLINFKESVIFAFLALKRIRSETNVLASVTGASKDSSSGVIHLP